MRLKPGDLKTSSLFRRQQTGNDGPTDAAGAFADGYSLEKSKNVHIDAKALLRQNNSYEFFREIGDLLITGPTGTNVMDVYILLIG